MANWASVKASPPGPYGLRGPPRRLPGGYHLPAQLPFSSWQEAAEQARPAWVFLETMPVLPLFPLQFVAFCSKHTEDNPEVIPYLSGRHQKTSPEYLASVEFRNVLSRCLTRVQAKRNKIYVYINELCTSFRAHSQRKKAVAPGPADAQDAPAAVASQAPAKPAKPCVGSKRQIRYLENLLRVYAKEIQRLQEQELDLAELDSQDSAYLQESRLKRRLMHVFKRLCQLKDCSSLTGRVIEQRIPYRGTRYPEVNRRIERLINQPEAFPDFADILKVVQKASARHSLGLPKRQMEVMAADAFRDVGARLQERRRLDLVYNFGSHLTDQYRPSECCLGPEGRGWLGITPLSPPNSTQEVLFWCLAMPVSVLLRAVLGATIWGRKGGTPLFLLFLVSLADREGEKARLPPGAAAGPA